MPISAQFLCRRSVSSDYNSTPGRSCVSLTLLRQIYHEAILFTVYHSNQLDILKSLLVELIRRKPLANPFQAEQILVQSPGMSQWLKIELAKAFSVAANIEFPLPATFIWTCFSQVLADVPSRSAFNKEAMTWKLMHLLPQMLEQPEFAALKQYLSNDDDTSRRYQLAEKIADIFDGYLVYRPEWIASWENDQPVAEIGDEFPWQAILWRRLYAYTAELGQSHYHRANLYDDFIAALNGFNKDELPLPERLFVFGISSLPPRYMDALKALGEHIDVHLMFTNPCRYYWGEIRDRKYLARLAAKYRQQLIWRQDHSEPAGQVSAFNTPVGSDIEQALHTQEVGNGLLASMGKQGRDNLYLLSQLQSNEIEAFVDIERDTLLHNLQADILNLQEHQDERETQTSQHKLPVSSDDTSVSVHSCHSPMREVEVLHDELLKMFAEDASLKPRDIIVMVADINAYSPAIHAVFGHMPGERFIPYSISDRSAEQENPVLLAFMQLLALPQSRCLASELLELLETPAILARFALSNEEFNQAKIWVQDSGIRWGLNADTASEFGLPATEQNTWQFGIERMLLGYAMPQSAGLFAADEDKVLAPFDEVQGLGAQLAGKLAQFIAAISHYRQQLNKTQSVLAWRECLEALLNDFFAVDLEGEIALQTIRDTLSQLHEQLTDAAYQEALTPAVLRQYLTDKLSGTRVSQRFLAGQVNFCTLMPMRSVPFRCVCLLGMNDGVYPRSVPPEGFDLMVGRGRPGDRSRREDDRYLFLEALISAQSRLYISYVGRSIQDNTTRSASVLVSELLEYCAQNYCLAGDEALASDDSGARLVANFSCQHAMTPFSPATFLAGSYAREWLPAAQGSGVPAGEFSQTLADYFATPDVELELVELQRFWRLPVQYFFNRRLNVMFGATQAVVADDEPFALDGLQSFQLRDELLQVLLEQNNPQQISIFERQQQAQGKLPVGSFGELEFASNRVQAEQLVDELQHLCSSPADDYEIALQFNLAEPQIRLRLNGWLTQRYASGLVRYRSGRIRAQDTLSAWIDHLALAAVGQSETTHLIGYDAKEGVLHYRYPPLDSQQQAQTLLRELLQLFCQGMNQPLAYFPATCLAGVEAELSRGKWTQDYDKAVKKMADTFNDGYRFSGEGGNDYIARIWPRWQEELAQQSYQLAQRVILPARQWRVDEDEK